LGHAHIKLRRRPSKTRIRWGFFPICAPVFFVPIKFCACGRRDFSTRRAAVCVPLKHPQPALCEPDHCVGFALGFFVPGVFPLDARTEVVFTHRDDSFLLPESRQRQIIPVVVLGHGIIKSALT
jgi:hypothetical protein